MVQSDKPIAPISAAWQQALRVCPAEVQHRVLQLPEETLTRMEELRFRLGQPVQVCGLGLDQFLHRAAGLTTELADAYTTTEDDLSRVVQGVTQSSLYAVEDELRRGFVTMPGGHRVGIAGRVVLYESGAVRSIRSITSVNIRIAKERLGAADRLRPFVARRPDGLPYSVLVVSPPQCGKTTLLRDLARQWSEGVVTAQGQGRKVCIVDERSELAGCLSGVPQFRLGPRADVLDACPKADGLLMAIRSLSPELVVTDEIGRAQDRDAILEATHAGVAVLASAHAASVDEWRQRPHMEELFSGGAFQRYVVLSRTQGPGTIERILDEAGRPLPGLGTLPDRGRHDIMRAGEPSRERT